jgi:hypothetical protein
MSELKEITVSDSGDIDLLNIDIGKRDLFLFARVLEKVSDLSLISYNVLSQVAEGTPLNASLTEINAALVAISKVGLARGEDLQMQEGAAGQMIMSGQCDDGLRRRCLERQVKESLGEIVYAPDTGSWLLAGKEATEDDVEFAIYDFCWEYGHADVSSEAVARLKADKPVQGGAAAVLTECLSEDRATPLVLIEQRSLQDEVRKAGVMIERVFEDIFEYAKLRARAAFMQDIFAAGAVD